MIVYFRKKRFRILFNYDDEGRVIGKKEPLPFNMTFLSGSTHITATREFVNFTINNPKAQVYIKWVNGTKIPDETVFSILNGNPQFGVPGAYKGQIFTVFNFHKNYQFVNVFLQCFMCSVK